MSTGAGASTVHHLLHTGLFCLKSNIFNPQFVNEVPEEYEGGSRRNNTSEYSTVKKSFL